MIAPSSRTASLFVAAALLVPTLAGCGGDGDDKAAKKPASSAPATPSATDKLLELGLTQTRAKQYDAAVATFTSVLALEPKNVNALYDLGYVAQITGKAKKAVGYYDQVIALAPKYQKALYNKAILVEKTDLDTSIALYERVVKVDPKAADAYMRLGFALLHQGDKTAGENALSKGVQIDPTMLNIEAPSYE